MFDHLAGNEPIKSYLTKAFQEKRLAQTLLFSGREGVGKSLFAKELAAHLLESKPEKITQENHPDLHVLRPEGKSGLYAIEAIREMIDQEHSAPFEAPAKVFILEEAHRMQPAAANALLKTLEEPAPDTTFILLSSSIQEMLPTILSRCTTLAFQPLSEEAIAPLLEAKGHSRRFAKLSSGSVGMAFELAVNPQIEEQRKILFQILATAPKYPELSRSLEQLEAWIEEIKEENPIAANKMTEYLFSLILIWFRDQHLRKMDSSSPLLFFPEEPSVSFSIPSLTEVEKSLQEARSALQRNIKLSICLMKLFD